MFDWQTFIVTSIPWAILLIYFVKHPEKAEKWYSIIARSLSFLSLKLEKSGVARDIQSDINSFIKHISPQVRESILPYGVKIKWIKSITREAFVKEGKVIIKMRYHKNQAKNFLYAILEWVTKGLIPDARHLLDKTVLRAAELVFINHVLTRKKRHDVKQLFLDEIYEPEVTKGSLLERYCHTFNNLNSRGLFIGVALQEFSSLGRRMGSILPDKKITLETIGFMNMLEKLSKKPPGEDVSPDFNGEIIKCSIVLIAKQETYLLHGLLPYLSWINGCIEKGIRSFYVCAIGDANIAIVRKIRDAYEESKKISIISENIYPLNGNRTIVLHMESKVQQGELI
jgi:hypothetical protein